MVVPYHRPVGGDHHHIQFVDVPELTCFRFCGTGHTGQLVIHTEVVLESDGSKGLGCSLNLHILLGLNCLVETVTPTAAFHDTARGFVHYLHLVVHYHVVDVLCEHRVGLQELDNGVNALALQGEILHQGILLLRLLCGRERCVVGDIGNGASHIREHEEVGV